MPKVRHRISVALVALAFTLFASTIVSGVASAPAIAATMANGWREPVVPLTQETGFLANDCGHPEYGGYGLPRQYHTGIDYYASANQAVYSIGDGVVLQNNGDFGAGYGKAVFVKYTAADNSPFIVLYGHVNTGIVANGSTVHAGDQIATIYPYTPNGPHLHLGLVPGTSYPPGDWGNLPCSSWTSSGPNTNGFVNPLQFLNAHPAVPPGPVVTATSSTEDAPYGGDFNGDGYGDVTLLHQISDGGMHAHVLYGGTGTSMFANAATFARALPGSDAWDWTRVKLATGRFNSDQYADVAIVHQLPDGGAAVHVLYGGASPFTYPTTFVRNLSAADGWNWASMKLVSGNFNGDGYDDLAIVHQVPDGGADIHILYGANGAAMFQNVTTIARHLSASDGWNWSQMKIAAGMFNNDNTADLVIVHEIGDGGMDVHILNGGASPFTNTNTFLRRLPATDGWSWSKVKLAAGPFNSDSYADLALLHQIGDGGMDVHVLYGNPVPFQGSTTFVRRLAGSDGWDWTKVKLSAGLFNSDSYGDLGLIHQLSDDGMNVMIVYGNVGTAMFQNANVFVRSLPATSGWSWSKVKLG